MVPALLLLHRRTAHAPPAHLPRRDQQPQHRTPARARAPRGPARARAPTAVAAEPLRTFVGRALRSGRKDSAGSVGSAADAALEGGLGPEVAREADQRAP